MIDNDYWAHIAPDGTTPWSFIDDAGYVYIKAGENLAYGFATSSGTVDGWMNSPGHRANILDEEFEEVGFGILDGPNFQDDENTVVVAIYATPYSLPVIKSDTTLETDETDDTVVATAAEVPAKSEATEETVVPTVTEVPTKSDLVIARSESDGFASFGEVEADSIRGRVITNLEALLGGKAPLMMYVSIGLLFLISLVYLMRHVRAVHQFIVYGEHQLDGHPLLEASMIYLLIWLILGATYGAVI
jgi:hypothetical protein